ncbi:MAG TPA: hypothetical protein PLH98_14540 [Ruminococcus flavefaciens]|nr:hypothetical protein [Ruminococcus flavefaciens]
MTDEEKKEAIAEAKDLYKNGKAKKNERVFTLRNITDEEFVKLNKIDKKYFYSSIDSKENWYNQRYKQLREMLKAFDVWEEFTGLKHKGEFYSFSQRNMEFLMMLFREYNGKFEHLKRGKVANSDGAYLLMVYNGILDIFYDANAPERLIESVMLKLWNRLNIPQRNIDASIDSVCEQCKRMVKKNIESNSYGMGLMEKLLWQAAFRRSFYRFLLYRDSIYSNMENIRQEELFEDSRSKNISSEEEELIELEIRYSTEILEAYDNDPEIQELESERLKMLGYNKKNPPLVRNVEAKFREISFKLIQRRKEVELNVILKYKPDYQYPEEMKNTLPADVPFTPLIQLLEKAMEEEKDQRDLFPITGMYDLIERMQKYFP